MSQVAEIAVAELITLFPNALRVTMFTHVRYDANGKALATDLYLDVDFVPFTYGADTLHWRVVSIGMDDLLLLRKQFETGWHEEVVEDNPNMLRFVKDTDENRS